jgi:uncharacterized protein (TIGR00369 family)
VTSIASVPPAPGSARRGERDRATARPDLRRLAPEAWAAALRDGQAGGLTGLLGCSVVRLHPGLVELRMPLRDELMLAPGDVLHGGTAMALADSAAGWGCLASLPDDVAGFTTSHASIDIVATTRVPDALACVATMLHGGRSTQVWDATVTRERDGRPLAHYRATQYLIPRS